MSQFSVGCLKRPSHYNIQKSTMKNTYLVYESLSDCQNDVRPLTDVTTIPSDIDVEIEGN